MSERSALLDEPDRLEILGGVALFAEFDPEELAGLAARCRERRFAKGETLWRVGDPGDELLVVASGELAVWGEGEAGEEIIARLGSSDVLGEIALLLDEPRSATVTCSRPTRALVLGRADFRDFVRDDARALASISQGLSRRVAALAHRAPARPRTTLIGVTAAKGRRGATLVSAGLATLLPEVTGRETLLVRLGVDGPALGQAGSDGVASAVRALGPGRASVLELSLDAGAARGDVVAGLHRLAGALGPSFAEIVVDLPDSPGCDPTAAAETCDVVVDVGAAGSASVAPALHTRVLRVVNRYQDGSAAIPVNHCEPFILPVEPLLRDAPLERQLEVLLGSPRLPVSRTMWRLARKAVGGCIGIAFGGGAAFGIAHVGVLQALEDGGITVDLVAGTSMGSIVALGYASGLSPEDMHEIAGRLGNLRTLLRILDPTLAGTGLLAGKRLIQTFSPLVAAETFDDLALPCQTVATDIESGERVCIGEGRVDRALRASCSIPIVFTPVRWGDRTLVDGSMVDPVPAEVAWQMGADVVIGVNVVPQLHRGTTTVISRAFKRVNRLNPLTYVNGQRGMPDAIDVLMNSLQTVQFELGHFKGLSADVRINVSLADFTWIEFHRALEIIERGREAAEAALPAVREVLQQRVGAAMASAH